MFAKTDGCATIGSGIPEVVHVFVSDPLLHRVTRTVCIDGSTACNDGRATGEEHCEPGCSCSTTYEGSAAKTSRMSGTRTLAASAGRGTSQGKEQILCDLEDGRSEGGRVSKFFSPETQMSDFFVLEHSDVIVFALEPLCHPSDLYKRR